MDDPQKGIQFGAEGLSIPLSQSNPQAAKCRLGTYYAKNKKLPESGRSLFASTESWKGTQLTDLKVCRGALCCPMAHAAQSELPVMAVWTSRMQSISVLAGSPVRIMLSHCMAANICKSHQAA